MTLYIQDENYHFDGFVSGVIVDNQRTAIFKKEGIEEHNLEIDFNSLEWHDLASFELVNNTVKIKAKNYAFYKEFYCLRAACKFHHHKLVNL